MSTYLVTGVAGFIASRVAEMLMEAGHQVVGIDNLNDYYDVRLKDYRLSRLLGEPPPGQGASKRSGYVGSRKEYANPAGSFRFRHIDIEDRAALEELFRGFRFDAVLNLAGRAGVRYSLENPHVYLTTNTLGTLNILEAMRAHGVRQHVLASSSSLYAGCSMPFTEDLAVNTPLSPYAASKKAAEMISYSYHQLYGIHTTVLRYFTVFGPASRPDMGIFRFIKWIDEGTPLQLFGDGSQARDFTYVDDIARGTILAARPLGFETINLGGGRNPVRMQVLISKIEELLGKKAVIAGQPKHAADVHETWADIMKAERLLGWKPVTSLEAGLRETVAWHRANAGWLKEIAV